MQKKIVLLGSTGSIGRQTLEVIAEHPDRFQITALAAGSNIELLAQQIKTFRPQYASVASADEARRLKPLLPDVKTEIQSGSEGLTALAALDGIDLVVVAVTGIHGLNPTLAALAKKTAVALANKETLVAGGCFVIKKAQEMQTPLIPVDSEHAAIFQCLEPENHALIDKLILTASGGPFLNYSRDELENVTPEKALQHPRWQMGPKITIDSAGLINKGLEVIEAHWLFGIEFADIEVIIHPQSIVHSMVQYKDGSVIAQMGKPDMRVPIQYALTYPERLHNSFPKLDFGAVGSLTFAKPDFTKFPGLKLAYEAGVIGGSMPAVYNAANEVAVELFTKRRLGFMQIPALIERVMQKNKSPHVDSLEDIIRIDRWARRVTYSYVKS